MRARLAIRNSGMVVELREVVLADKPEEMLLVSPKATVPVLVLENGKVIDESRDIMLWALQQSDPNGWLKELNEDSKSLIDMNDNDFKQHLDHYKYSDRFPDKLPEFYRLQGEVFLQNLEQRLNDNLYLNGDRLSMSDMAIFPFVRQFAFVDKEWFDQSQYNKVKVWLEKLLGSKLFKEIMDKNPQWESNTMGCEF